MTARGILQGNQGNNQSAPQLPRSRDGNDSDRPMLLNGFLFCPGCNNQLVVTGANGTAYGCKTCKYLPVAQQHLYSQMPRKLGTQLIAKAICDEVLASAEVVDRCVAECLVETEKMRKPDPAIWIS